MISYLMQVRWMIAAAIPKGSRCGKSGLHRAECQITSGRGDSQESATEIYRLSTYVDMVRLEGQCKRLPPGW